MAHKVYSEKEKLGLLFKINKVYNEFQAAEAQWQAENPGKSGRSLFARLLGNGRSQEPISNPYDENIPFSVDYILNEQFNKVFQKAFPKLYSVVADYGKIDAYSIRTEGRLGKFGLDIYSHSEQAGKENGGTFHDEYYNINNDALQTTKPVPTQRLAGPFFGERYRLLEAALCDLRDIFLKRVLDRTDGKELKEFWKYSLTDFKNDIEKGRDKFNELRGTIFEDLQAAGEVKKRNLKALVHSIPDITNRVANSFTMYRNQVRRQADTLAECIKNKEVNSFTKVRIYHDLESMLSAYKESMSATFFPKYATLTLDRIARYAHERAALENGGDKSMEYRYLAEMAFRSGFCMDEINNAVAADSVRCGINPNDSVNTLERSFAPLREDIIKELDMAVKMGEGQERHFDEHQYKTVSSSLDFFESVRDCLDMCACRNRTYYLPKETNNERAGFDERHLAYLNSERTDYMSYASGKRDDIAKYKTYFKMTDGPSFTLKVKNAPKVKFNGPSGL